MTVVPSKLVWILAAEKRISVEAVLCFERFFGAIYGSRMELLLAGVRFSDKLDINTGITL